MASQKPIRPINDPGRSAAEIEAAKARIAQLEAELVPVDLLASAVRESILAEIAKPEGKAELRTAFENLRSSLDKKDASIFGEERDTAKQVVDSFLAGDLSMTEAQAEDWIDDEIAHGKTTLLGSFVNTMVEVGRYHRQTVLNDNLTPPFLPEMWGYFNNDIFVTNDMAWEGIVEAFIENVKARIPLELIEGTVLDRNDEGRIYVKVVS